MTAEFQVEPLAPVPEPAQPAVQAPTPSPYMRFIKFALIGLLILVVAVVGYFWMSDSFREGSVAFELEGPSSVTGGELAEYTLKYANESDISLQSVQLLIYIPKDSIVLDEGKLIRNQDTILIKHDRLVSGEKKEKKLGLFIVGDKGNIKNLKAQMTYKPESISSSFKKEKTIGVTISALAMPMTLVVPPTAVSGQSVDYLIDYRNESEADLSDFRVVAKYPDGFKVTKSSPEPTFAGLWELKTIKKGQGARITVTGTLKGNEHEAKKVAVTMQRKLAIEGQETYIDVQKIELATAISNPPLSLALTVNNSTNYTAALGDTLNYSLKYKNNGQVDVRDSVLTAKLEGAMFDPATVESSGFFDSNTNTITWNAGALSELGLLRPNQSGTATFSVKLKNSFGSSIGANNSLVKVIARLEPSGAQSVSQELVVRISNKPTFSQSLTLSRSDFGSSGPYPPRVGQKTAFNIAWQLTNPANEVRQAKITATLAPGVTWENKSLATIGGSPAYNSKNSSVTWDIGSLPAGSGVIQKAAEGAFQIASTPSTNQAGRALLLLKNIRFEGTDSVTGEHIVLTLPDADSQQVTDSDASGIVEK